MGESGDVIENTLVFLLDIRVGWEPSAFRLIEMVSLAGSSASGGVDLDAVADLPGIDLAHRIARLEPRGETSLEDGIRALDRKWRLPLIKAYGGLRSELPEDCALVPTRRLDLDTTGHFEQMKFARRSRLALV